MQTSIASERRMHKKLAASFLPLSVENRIYRLFPEKGVHHSVWTDMAQAEQTGTRKYLPELLPRPALLQVLRYLRWE